MEQKLVKININIAGRAYPVKVTPEEEVIARDLESKINAQVQLFQKNYPTKDIRDCLSMAIIQLSFEKKESGFDKLHEKASAIQQLMADHI